MVAQIAVKADGTILFDGRKADISELDRLLTPIIERRGVIWFRSVALRGQLHPKAIEVLKAIAAKRIPVRPFPKDILEYIGADARLRKRT